MGFITRGIRNALRNPIRTGSIVVILGLSTGLALTMLLARQAVSAKIESVKSSIGNTITISPAGAQGFEGGGEPLTNAVLAPVAGQAHVVGVIKTLRDRLSSDNSTLVSAIEAGSLGRRFRSFGEKTGDPEAAHKLANFVPPVNAIGTTDPVSAEGPTPKLASGTTIDGASNDDIALVGSDVAAKNNLTAGSTFTAYGTTITVKGIFDTGTKFANNVVIFPLATLQRLSAQPDQVSSATVRVDSITNLATVTTALKDLLGDKADVTNQQDTSSQALEPLENIKSVALFSLVGAVAAGAVIIFLTMLMIVRERRREIGVFKAIGSSNAQIATQFVSESLALTVLGSVVGLVGGVLASNSVVHLLVTSSADTAPGGGFEGRMGGGIRQAFLGGPQAALQNIHATIGYEVLLYGLGGALIIALIGSAIPAYLTAKVRPAEVMRGE